MKKTLFAAMLALFIGMGTPAQAHWTPVKDLEVFVDVPTGLVFIKLPKGWKFVTRLEGLDPTRLPRHVNTTLLLPHADEPPEWGAMATRPHTTP